MKYLLLIVVMTTLAGCSSTASRMADCQAQGISRDACYLAEQNRKAVINGAAEKQAMENAAHQFAQTAHKTGMHAWSAGDITVVKDKFGIVTIDGKPAVMDAEDDGNKTFSQGYFQVIFYKNGKVALINNGLFVAWMRPHSS
jgi:hypothetical protein